MTVSDDVCRPDSALMRYLDERLPDRHLVADQWAQDVQRLGRYPVTLTHSEYRFVGLALEIRVGLDLARRPAYISLLRSLPPETCEQVFRAAGFERPALEHQIAGMNEPTMVGWQRVTYPETIDEDQVAALLSCYDVASKANLVHVFRHIPVETLRWAMSRGPFRDSFKRDSDTDREVERVMRLLWQSYLDVGRASLTSFGDLKLTEFVMAPGYAIFDLLLGSTLVEVKNHTEPVARMERVLDQVLTYALLNKWQPHLNIDTVAAYFGWQAVTVSVELDELLQTATRGETPTFGAISSGLREAIADDLEMAEFVHTKGEIARHRA